MSVVPAVGVVVLAHGPEPWLRDCVAAVLASTGVRVDLVVVDNDARDEDLRGVDERDGVRVLRPGRNTGFAGGCNLAAASLTTPLLALVNSDCVIGEDTLAALAGEAGKSDVGPVMASVRFADRPEIVNSSGNPVHVLGTCWAGGIDEPELRREPYDVTAASGACLMIRRELWRALEGFDEEYFAYLEDTELSLRCWRLGLASRCVPAAVARHHYEFSRNPTKMYLLERNRLMLLATLWPAPVLLALAPLLVGFEVALLALATAQGWGSQKIRGWWWLARHTDHLRNRRALLAAERRVPDHVWMSRLTPEFATHVVGSPAATRIVNAVVRAWWAAVQRPYRR